MLSFRFLRDNRAKDLTNLDNESINWQAFPDKIKRNHSIYRIASLHYSVLPLAIITSAPDFLYQAIPSPFQNSLRLYLKLLLLRILFQPNSLLFFCLIYFSPSFTFCQSFIIYFFSNFTHNLLIFFLASQESYSVRKRSLTSSYGSVVLKYFIDAAVSESQLYPAFHSCTS